LKEKELREQAVLIFNQKLLYLVQFGIILKSVINGSVKSLLIVLSLLITNGGFADTDDEENLLSRKGLIDEEGNKKLAFNVLKDFYAEKWDE